MTRKIALAAILLCGVSFLFSNTALADTMSLTLSDGNSAISGFTGPYATVTVDLTSSTIATVTFTSLTGGGDIFLLGDGGSVALNVNATGFDTSSITGSNSGTGFTPGPYSVGLPGNEDGFGAFNLTINSFDGFTHSSDTISFQLTDLTGTWGSASDVLTANADGFSAAAHIFVTTSPADASNGALATGFAANGTSTVAAPEPSSLLLLGLGVVIISFSSKLRR